MNLTKSLACLLVVAVALIGCPAAKVTVPDVVGQTQANASATLLALDLTVTLSTAYSDTVAAGNVISQNPVADTQVDAGSNVALVISEGPEPVETVIVPNVTGMTVAAATASFTTSGLTLGAEFTESSATVAAGLVIRTSPLAGASVNEGSAVAVIVSSGPATVTVPDVVGSMTSDAVNELAGVGLSVGAITYENNAAAQGTVLTQTPVAGASALEGATVALVVSNGPEQVSVPNIVGLTVAAATAALTDAGLVVGTSTEEYDAGAAGLILEQGTTAGTIVSAGTAVNVVVSVGAPNVVGMQKEAAITALEAVGLTCEDPADITALAGNLNPLGMVTAQAAPVAGVVNLSVSGRTMPAIVDGVTTLANWKTALATAGLQLDTVAYATDLTKVGKVKSSIPAAAAVTTDTDPAITITVYTGTVPFVLGSTLAQATATFAGNLTLDPVNNAAVETADLVATTDTTKVGTIASQTPAANSTIAVASDGTFSSEVDVTLYGLLIPYVVGQNEVTASDTLNALYAKKAAFVNLTHTVKATTEAQFATVATETIAPGIGGVAAGVPEAGVLSASNVVNLNAYGLDVRPLVKAGGGAGFFDITTPSLEAAAVALADSITIGDTTIPYTVTYTAGLLADIGELLSIKDANGVAITNAAANTGPYYTSFVLEISGLLANDVVGKQIGTVTDDSTDDTAWGLLCGDTLDAAHEFPAANVVVNYVMATSADQIGEVLTQTPAVVAPGVEVACTTPTLTVASGVPDYTFETTDAAGSPVTVADAVTALTAFGLTPSITWVDQTTVPDVDLNYVVSTLPAPGAFVTASQAITVYGAGYKVPNLVGMTVVNAQAAITALGATKLTNGTVTGTGGTVTSQSPAAFTVVAPGTAVNLVGAK